MIIINGRPHTLGEALYIARRRAGLTQVQLAAKVGISNCRVSELERGQATLSAQRWLMLIAACGWRIEARKNVAPVSQSAASRRTNAPRTVTQTTGDSIATHRIS